MPRTQKILFFAFLLVLAGLVYLEATRPQPLNWFPSYYKADKIPLGTFVIHSLLEDFFKDNFEETDIPPFEFLQNTIRKGNYLFINDIVDFDKTELDSLLTWTSGGNNVFISANYFGEKLLDTLNLKMNTVVSISSIGTEPLVKLVNPNLPSERIYHIQQDLPIRYFSRIDTVTQTVLGISGLYKNSMEIEDPHINFLRTPMGQGNIFLHSQPEVFSNFFLVEEGNPTYTAAVLSYLNNGNTLFWDNYYKSGKPVNISPLGVLLENRNFKWAYYFVLLGVLLFVIFEGKRKQRSIPIVEPLANRTYEYTKTIAGLYLEKKEYKAIAHKQILLFLEYIRTQLKLPTENVNERFYKALAEHSGNTLEDTTELFQLIGKISEQDKISRDELAQLYRSINTFTNPKEEVDQG